MWLIQATAVGAVVYLLGVPMFRWREGYWPSFPKDFWAVLGWGAIASPFVGLIGTGIIEIISR